MKKVFLLALFGIFFSTTGVLAQQLAEQEELTKTLWETHFSVTLTLQEYGEKRETSQTNLNDWIALRQAFATDPNVDLKYIDDVIAGMNQKLN